jgi:hypothetical protein
VQERQAALERNWTGAEKATVDAAASRARAHARLAAGAALISAASASHTKTKHTHKLIYTLRLNTKHTLNPVRLPRAQTNHKLTFEGGRGEGQTTGAQSLVAK